MNTIPGDTDPLDPSGLRLGTPELTRIGMKENEMGEEKLLNEDVFKRRIIGLVSHVKGGNKELYPDIITSGENTPYLTNSTQLNVDQTEAIEKLARENNIRIVGRVPFDPVFTESMVLGQTVLEYAGNSKIRNSINEIWRNIRNQLEL